MIKTKTEICIQVIELPFTDPEGIQHIQDLFVPKDLVIFKASKIVSSTIFDESTSELAETTQGIQSIEFLKKCASSGLMPRGLDFTLGTPKVRELIRVFGTAVFSQVTVRPFNFSFLQGTYKNKPESRGAEVAEEISGVYTEEFGVFCAPYDKKKNFLPPIDWFDMYQSNPEHYQKAILDHLIFVDPTEHLYYLIRNSSLINSSLHNENIHFRPEYYKDMESLFKKLSNELKIILPVSLLMDEKNSSFSGDDLFNARAKGIEFNGIDNRGSSDYFVLFDDNQFKLVNDYLFERKRKLNPHQISVNNNLNQKEVLCRAVFYSDPFGIKEQAYFPKNFDLSEDLDCDNRPYDKPY